MKESDAERKFRIVLEQLDLDEQVKVIEFCENRLAGGLGAVEAVVEYHIFLDKRLLTDPESRTPFYRLLDSEWTEAMANFPDGVVPCLPKDDRVFLVFLHELGHLIKGHCLEDSPPEDSPESQKVEQEAWDYAWTFYRAYRAGQKHEQ